MSNKYKSPLHETVETTPTDFWNDSCSIEELTYAIDNGAVGATSNPTIVLNVLKQEMHLWKDRLNELIVKNPEWSEVEITWKIFEEIGAKGAELLLPVFKRENGRKGRLSVQTNPANYRTPDAIVEQAVHFDSLAPNIQVKIPVTKAGIEAIEEATYRGVNINATVCFTVPQSLAVAEAVERGLKRREAEGKPVDDMTPVCTIMVGRMDDWLKVIAKKEQIAVTPGYMDWAGIACMKKAYAIYKERGYRSRLLAAAYRHHMHWSEFIGGDLILTIPYKWQKQFNASDIEVKERMQNPVPAEIVDYLYSHFDDFKKAYDEDGMSVEEFDTYGGSVRTLRGFIQSYHDLQGLIRDFMLPDPDK
ncbi:MAG: transaldolase [Chloroflexota bacterium]|nr:transaldolase [Chloroflexota bacterium]